MIIVRLRGGLGNQLFQFAAALSLGESKGMEVKADLYTYTRHPYRKYELHNFNIPLEEATREEVHAFTGSNFLIRYLNKRENYFHCPAVFAQPHYHFYEDFFQLPVPVYLSGYWQSEKYFSGIDISLRSMLTPRNSLDGLTTSLMAEMKQPESVALHVRRTDHTGQHKGLSFFHSLEMEYYHRAIALMQEKVKQPRYYIFSDDISWSREQFKHLNGAVFVSHNTGDDSFRDLLLMSACKNQIIANSTFSWWGAWLNNDPHKTVIAPQVWFRTVYFTGYEPVYASRYYNTKDLIPEGWIKI